MTESLHKPSLDDTTVSALPSGLLMGSRIRTPDGALPVEFLEPGDRVVTRSGVRRLVGLTILVLAETRIVRIRASSLGHDRPDQDLLLAPEQSVLIRDWRAQVLYDAPVAAIPACRLVDGEFILTETQAEVRLFQLHFEEDEVVYAEGLEIACLDRLPAATLAAA